MENNSHSDQQTARPEYLIVSQWLQAFRVVVSDFAKQELMACIRREIEDAERRAEAMREDAGRLPARIIEMCKRRGWSLHWTHRGAYLHLESSELVEAVRGKHGDPLKEAADVLLVLMSITESNGIAWADVRITANKIVEDLMVKPPYPGEERDAARQQSGEEGK